MAVKYCEEQEDSVDRSVDCLCTLLTALLVVIVSWGVLRCVWLTKLILAPGQGGPAVEAKGA